MATWIGSGMRAWMVHPMHDLTTEELQEYVQGSEYAELPEPARRDPVWPREEPDDLTMVDSRRTGFEADGESIHEVWDREMRAAARSSPKATTGTASGHYDLDLTQQRSAGHLESTAFDDGLEPVAAHAPIAGAQFTGQQRRQTMHMRWHGGRWVPAPHDTLPPPLPHVSQAEFVNSPIVGTEVVDESLDLGPTGDGGYSRELARHAAQMQVSAGAEDAFAEVFDPRPGAAAAAQEGIAVQVPPNAAGPLTGMTSEPRPPRADCPPQVWETDAERLAHHMIRNPGEGVQKGQFLRAQHGWIHTEDRPRVLTATAVADDETAEGSGEGAQAAAQPASDADAGQPLQQESWEATDFFSPSTNLMEVPGEGDDEGGWGDEAAGVAAGEARTVNGVPVDALDARVVVPPELVRDEHEDRVFSGLYPRRSGEEMTEFERMRLARCLEQHQKHGVPLGYDGVDPFSNNAFVRRRNPWIYKADDDAGRKHDLAVEFKMRQQSKLGHDVDRATRPNVRLPDDESDHPGLYSGQLQEAQRSFPILATVTDLSAMKLLSEGLLQPNGDNPYRHYGNTTLIPQPDMKFTTLVNRTINRVEGRDQTYRGYTAPERVAARREAELLSREVAFEKRRQADRARKEQAYRVRMGLAPAADTAEPAEDAGELAQMRSAPPEPQAVEMAALEHEDDDTRMQAMPNLRSHPDERSVYGRTPWKEDVRYTVWAMLGVHWRDLDAERLQLRGTGFYDNRHGVEMKATRPNTLARIEAMGWDSLTDQTRDEMWEHFRSPLSKGHHLMKPGREFPRAGPARETVNDLTVRRDGEQPPSWAFPGRLRHGEAEAAVRAPAVYDWRTGIGSGAPYAPDPILLSAAPPAGAAAAEEQGEAVPVPVPARLTPRPRVLRAQAAAYHSAAAARSARGRRRALRRACRWIRSGATGQGLGQHDGAPLSTAPLRVRAQWPCEPAAGWPADGSAAVVLGIDGVIHRGGAVLPGAGAAVGALLQARVPTVFYADEFSGWSEEALAQDLGAALGVPVPGDSVLLAAPSLLREAMQQFADDPVLVIGPAGAADAARAGGLRNPVTPEALAERFPHYVPSRWHGRQPPAGAAEGPRPSLYAHPGPAEAPPDFRVAGIAVLGEPQCWYTALQLCLDVLRAQRGAPRGPSGLLEPSAPQACPVFACSTRLLRAGSHSVPRLGTGAFLAALRALYREVSARDLVVTPTGRPSPAAFAHLEWHLEALCGSMHPGGAPLTHIYHVGDSVADDVAACGAYRDAGARRWWSVLVGTGVSPSGNSVLGRTGWEDLAGAQMPDSLGIPERERLHRLRQERRLDAAYQTLGMFVAELLDLEYHPSAAELATAAA
eukprot:TRINITY_DN21793_c0_g1_i1.p1 TRINITY_DN21793_c0_g1~~TRINITY_DN21793_c0_g1_i1.p1  ORF type:complete len:1533 (+),score=383.21 TRINITY_DN21793_c0_g1_i1:556-4599(+)